MKNIEIVDIEEIQELLLSFAEGDYSRRLPISDNRNERDTIISGINMLGEELEDSTVSKEYFKSIYNAISDIVIVTDASGIITSINKATIDLLKISADKLIGLSLLNILESPIDTRAVAAFISGEIPFKSFETEIELHGKKRIFLSTLSKINSRFKSQEGILVIAKDVTKERNIEGEILNAIIDTEEKERRRLANDLHDALGQELNSVKMMFDALLFIDKRTKKFNEVLELCKNIIDGCIDSTRHLSYDLMPKTLEDGELFSAFEELERSHEGLIKINLIIPEKEYEISKVRKINIFRILQEFITNTLKHSGASDIVIETFIENKNYCFTIADNGKGFNVEKKSKGSGIKNIRTRLKAIDAKYEFLSYPNSGTKLKFCIS